MLIGLCGDLHCGKSTVAAQLVEYHGFTLHRIAGPLKNMMRCLGLSEDEIEGHLKEKPCDLLGGKTPRFAMQTLGLEWGRDTIHFDLWLNAWVRTMPKGRIVADDVRFPNTANRIREMGGHMIRIERPMDDNLERAHASEGQDLGPYSIVIENDGTLDDLGAKVERTLTNLRAMNLGRR